jgi:hypothetical protein
MTAAQAERAAHHVPASGCPGNGGEDHSGVGLDLAKVAVIGRTILVFDDYKASGRYPAR